jgi:hypothetical protein
MYFVQFMGVSIAVLALSSTSGASKDDGARGMGASFGTMTRLNNGG